jgi:hypothetical protein
MSMRECMEAEERPAALPDDVLEKWQRADHIRLVAGELTAGELRAVKAVVAAIARELRPVGQDRDAARLTDAQRRD